MIDMKVLAIVPSIYDTSPGQRFRIEQWEPHLKKLGVEITYAPFETEDLNAVIYQKGNTAKKAALVMSLYLKRLQRAFRVKKFDLVYVFRESALLGPAVFERLVKWQKVPMVFDFDDSIFLPNSSEANAKFEFLKFTRKADTVCRLSSHIMPGNYFLADYAKKFNQNVTVVPTTIDTEKYKPLDNKIDSKRVVVGWSGSRTTVLNLNTLRETIGKLAQKEDFLFRVIGTENYQIDRVEIKSSNWKAETEVEDLSEIDIGIMPLPDDDWSRGKCGLKALQYMALGIPTVCTKVGANIDIIEDGVNGFLAADENEWIEKISRLIHNASLRNKIGEAGKRTVDEKYSALVQAPRVFGIFKSVIEK